MSTRRICVVVAVVGSGAAAISCNCVVDDALPPCSPSVGVVVDFIDNFGRCPNRRRLRRIVLRSTFAMRAAVAVEYDGGGVYRGGGGGGPVASSEAFSIVVVVKSTSITFSSSAVGSSAGQNNSYKKVFQ